MESVKTKKATKMVAYKQLQKRFASIVRRSIYRCRIYFPTQKENWRLYNIDNQRGRDYLLQKSHFGGQNRDGLFTVLLAFLLTSIQK